MRLDFRPEGGLSQNLPGVQVGNSRGVFRDWVRALREFVRVVIEIPRTDSESKNDWEMRPEVGRLISPLAIELNFEKRRRSSSS
jgi:hypothetical protein